MSDEKGRKFDHGKSLYNLLPPHALEEVCKVLTFGSEKYEDENWRKVEGGKARYFAAAMRHLWAIARGEKNDPETGLSHAAHAACCVLFLLEFELDKADHIPPFNLENLESYKEPVAEHVNFPLEDREPIVIIGGRRDDAELIGPMRTEQPFIHQG